MEHYSNYGEFSDPRLVAIYNTVNPIDGYKKFYVDIASKLSASTIVDMGCGSGLLTCELAKAGHQLIGIDPSSAMLGLARKSPCGEQVQWIEGGVEKLEAFQADLAIMTGHVAQFFLDDAGWQAALSSIHKALRPGGHLVFESRNPDVELFADWPTETSHQKLQDPVAGPIEWWQELAVKDARVKYEIHYLFKRSGEELVSACELRFRTQEEICQSLSSSGFSVQCTFGDWDSSPVGAYSPEMIFVAKRR
ncbi:MAG: class I SAM-dependent methyltransferase [Chloroflexi bacterium]|nr:class I SAM-dependent methyltransferase [Chloroflexota bacterium]